MNFRKRKFKFNMNYVYMIIGVLFFLMFIFFIGKPFITGNVVADTTPDKLSCKQELKISKNNLDLTKSELDECNNLKDSAIADLEQIQYKPEKCDPQIEQDLTECKKLKENLLKSLKRAQDNVKEFENIEESKGDYNQLAENSANNICCKQRVDNPDVNSYTLIDNKISCQVNGELALNCP